MSALDPDRQARLEERLRRIQDDPTSIRVVFPALAREVARDDEVRVQALVALDQAQPDRDALLQELRDLYRFGDADERRAVLLGLDRLDIGDGAEDLVHDALRTNDTRLVAAAMGPYGARVLDDAAWRQGVLKCLFVGVPTSAVHGLDARADETLRQMVASYAEERTAAGREVPADALALLDEQVSRSDQDTHDGQEG